MKILAIESSCDETAVSVVENGQKVLSNAIASQIATHAETKGVVPEVAAREHLKAMLPVLEQALKMANVSMDDIDAIAATYEPGLIGSLLVGRATAEALSLATGKPLIKVNHIQGHLYSTWLDQEEIPQFPILTLTVSGGHNLIVLKRGHNDDEFLGQTLDDAAGEAFDKVARMLGLGYPGGPAIEKLALTAGPTDLRFPLAKVTRFHFSFSGLKTSVLYHLKKHPEILENDALKAEVAYAFQEAALGALLNPFLDAVEATQPAEVHLGGGVSANQRLRVKLQEGLDRIGFKGLVRWPKKLVYCTDNAAMIGARAYNQRSTS